MLITKLLITSNPQLSVWNNWFYIFLIGKATLHLNLPGFSGDLWVQGPSFCAPNTSELFFSDLQSPGGSPNHRLVSLGENNQKMLCDKQARAQSVLCWLCDFGQMSELPKLHFSHLQYGGNNHFQGLSRGSQGRTFKELWHVLPVPAASSSLHLLHLC